MRISTFIGVDIDAERWTELTDTTGIKKIRHDVREHIVAIVREQLDGMGVLANDRVSATGTRGITQPGEQK